jgi:hypothetical protein
MSRSADPWNISGKILLLTTMVQKIHDKILVISWPIQYISLPLVTYFISVCNHSPTDSIFVFHMILTISSKYFFEQHEPANLCSEITVRFPWTSKSNFIYYKKNNLQRVNDLFIRQSSHPFSKPSTMIPVGGNIYYFYS